MKILLILLIVSINVLGYTKHTAATTFDDNIKIRMVENVDSTNRSLTFICFTEKHYGCSNYSVQSSFTVINDKVTLNFTGIIKPGTCLRSIGPASTRINLGTLANKNYELEFNIGNSKITGQITVTSVSFSVTLPTLSKIQIINPVLNRVPDNTIHGSVHYHSKTTGPTVQKFIDSLKIFGAIATNYTPGDYGNFQIDANGQIIQKQDLGYYFTQHYIFYYSGSSEQLKDLVKRFGIYYPELLLIKLHTSKGDVFYSWTQ